MIYSPYECWEWTAATDKYGYGLVKFCKKMYYAHRVSWFLKNGAIPSEKLVCHNCDNPPCENPKHLFLGTSKDNTQDAVRKGRMASGKKHGSKTHPERIARGDRNGSRLHPERLARGDKNGSRTRPESRPRGESNSRSKLTNLIVFEIRKRYLKGETQINIAKDLRVSQQNISSIVNRKSWAHV